VVLGISELLEVVLEADLEALMIVMKMMSSVEDLEIWEVDLETSNHFRVVHSLEVQDQLQ